MLEINKILHITLIVLAVFMSAITVCEADTLPLAEIKTYNGTPTLFVKGKPHMGLVLWSQPMPAYTDEEALHIYTEDIPPWNENPDQSIALASMDSVILNTIARDRNAHYIIRIGTQAPSWWLKANPDQRVEWDGHPTSWAAFASEKWRKDAGDAISRQIEHIQASKYADRVIAFLIGGGDAGEWAIAGDANYPDTSSVNQNYFRVWLRTKYKNDVAQIRKAWNESTVTFNTATIPLLLERSRKDYYYFRNPSKSRKVIDFYTYWNWLTADTILHFARIIKTKSNGQMLAGAFYGYNIGGGFPADTQRNAHGAAQVLLESPYIDFMAGPFMYYDRQIGGSEVPRTIEDSLRIHNKIWFNEADIRTYPTKSKENIYISGVQDSLEVMKRGLSWSIIRGNGIWMGWADNTIKDWLHKFEEIVAKVPDTGRSRVDEMAFILDDDSAFYMTTDNYISITSRCFQIMEASRCGVPYSIFSLKDLLSGNVPDHKVYIFMDAFHLTPDQRDILIARFKRNNAVAVWEYAPGFASDTGLSVNEITATTGMNVEFAGSGTPTVVLESFEGSYTLFGTGYSVDPAGITTITTNVTEGSRSLYAPLDAVYEWANAEIGVQFTAPVNVSTYNILSVDLYIPNGNFGVTCDIDIHDAAGYQRFYSIPIGTGWNKVSVPVGSITRNVTAITGVKLVIPTPPATAGSYFLLDNIRAESAPVGVPSVRITNYAHAITSGLPANHIIGTKYEKFTADSTIWDTYVSPKNVIGPIFQINDTSVTTLGKLDINSSIGLGLKKMDGWTSIYSCAPSISAELMRGICKFAGIHVYSNTRDFFAANNNWVMLHSQGAGDRVIKLPEKCNVYDIFNNSLVGKAISEIRLTSSTSETKLYYLLDPALHSVNQSLFLDDKSDKSTETSALSKLRLAVNWNTELDADFAAGERKAIVMGLPQITTGHGGKFGEGIHITSKNDGLGYNDPKNVNPKAGTVEFWFKSDWNGKDALPNPPHNYLFESVDATNHDHIKILKIDWGSGSNSLRVEVWSDGKMSASIDWSGVQNWEKGEWHHIVLTWAPNDYKLYVDKLLVGSSNSGAVPSRSLPTIALGYTPTPGDKMPAMGTFDKLRIYDYPVNANDVATMYSEGE